VIARLFGVAAFALLVLALGRVAFAQQRPCTTFIDNRHGHLVLTVRQKEPVELYAYVGVPPNGRDEVPADFTWDLDQAGARVVKDETLKGHATFFPGLQRKLYRVTITGFDHARNKCSPTTLQIEVDLDYEQFVAVDGWSGTAHDEFSPGTQLRSGSGEIRTALEFSQLSVPLYVGISVSRAMYQHPSNAARGTCPAADPGCVTTIAPNVYGPRGTGQRYVPVIGLTESVFDARAGVKVIDPRVYLGIAYVNRSLSAPGYGSVSGVAFVADKLPDLDQRFSFLASFVYAPSASGIATAPDGRRYTIAYAYARYRLGATYVLYPGHYFVEGGAAEDRGAARANAPADFTRSQTFFGIGARL
jgi:hypothetical protein